MCGIHGFVNGKKKAEMNSDDFLRSGFTTNMLRGVDSAGIAVVSPTKYWDIAKLPVAGMYLPSNKAGSALISRARHQNTASMCHVRAATVGNINYANTHPFSVENEAGHVLVGVHNGTLTNWKNKKGASEFDVDSAWAMWRIAEEKADAFEEFQGAYAMVWWSSEYPDVLNMARNKERPLIVAFTDDGNMVYASEAGMIHWLCERHNIKIVGNLKELDVGMLYRFDISEPTQFTKSALPTYVSPVATTSTGSSGGNWGGSSGNYHSSYKTTIEKMDAIFDKIRKDDDEFAPPKGETTTGGDLTLAELDKAEDEIVQQGFELVPTKPQSKKSSTTDQEVMDAHFMNLLGCKGTFSVMGCDDRSGYLYGSFTADDYDGDNNAVWRDVPEDFDWRKTSGQFAVTIDGVNDSGNDFIFVVSSPIEELEAA